MIKILKNGIRYNGKYIAISGYKTTRNDCPNETITIYSKSILDDLPKELNPKNDSDMMTDYFETDRAYITPENKYYKELLHFCN